MTTAASKNDGRTTRPDQRTSSGPSRWRRRLAIGVVLGLLTLGLSPLVSPVAAAPAMAPDSTPPETALTSTPTNPNLLTGVFEFSGSDADSGVVGFECRLGGGAFAPCTSPHTEQVSIFTVPVSSVFEVRAVDGAGNVDPTPARFVWTVNPQPGFIDVVLDTVPDGPQAFVFTTTSATNPPNTNTLPTSISLDDDAASPRSNTFNSRVLNEGTYTITAPDVAGFSGSWSCSDESGDTVASPVGSTATIELNFGERATCTYTATELDPPDITPPDTTITSGPTDPNLLVGDVVFTGSDAESGVAGFECRFNNGAWAGCTSPASFTIDVSSLTGHPPFNFPVDVRAVDGAGNVDPTPARFVWTVNPQPGFIDVVLDTVPDGPQAFVFTTTSATNPPNTNTLPGSFTLDDDAAGPLSNTFNSSVLNEGTYTITAPDVAGFGGSWSCTDESGDTVASPVGSTATIELNFGERATCTYTATPLDATGPVASPVVTPAANAAGWHNTDVTVTWNWVDAESGIDPANCTTTTTTTTEGSVGVIATCSDTAGNQSVTNVNLQIDRTAPAASITANPPTSTTSSDATFEFTGSDATSGVGGFECQIDGAGFTGCSSPLALTGLAEVQHTFEVRAIDVAGNLGTPASFTWTVEAPPGPVAVCGGHEVFEAGGGAFVAPSFTGNVIVGTPGRDVLVGTTGPDLILGLGGQDDIRARNGADVICGGTGADIINAAGGADLVFGEGGADIINGGGGRDILHGNGGADVINGKGGNDVLFGGGGADILNGNRGADDIFGNGGNDSIDGGDGRDDCNGGAGNDTAVRCESVVKTEN